MFFSRQVENKSYIRILHAAPNQEGTDIDVYANQNLIAKDLDYADFSEYYSVIPGEYTIDIYPNEDKKNLLFSKKITVDEKKIYTIAVIEKNDTIDLLLIDDMIRPMPEGALLLRFLHLSPIVPMVNVTLTDGTSMFKNVAYTNVTNYTPFRPGIIEFQIKNSETGEVILTVPNIRFKPNRYYSIYLVGNGTKEAPVQVLIPLDGNSYLTV